MLATGCAKKKECEALTNVVKTERENFSKNSDASSSDDFKKMADVYKKAGGKIRDVKVSVPDVKKKQDEYLELVDDMANAADLTSKVLGGATDKVDAAKKAADKVQNRSERDLYIDLLRSCE